MGVVAIPKVWITGDVLDTTNLNLLNSTIYNEFNGNIDDSNIKTGANIDGNKLLAGSVGAGILASNVVTDAKMDYTSAKVLRVGPNFPGGTNGKRIAVGRKAFTFVSGRATFTITFSSDSQDGNPAFVDAATLVITGGVEHVSSLTNFYVWQIVSVLASSVNISVYSIENSGTPGTVDGTDVSSGTFHWHAIGNV